MDTGTKPEIADAARRLLERALAEDKGSPSVAVAAARACEELVGCLVDFIGQSGARALYDRSLALNRQEHPWLVGAVASPGEPPWPALRACLDANEASAMDASVALVATFVTLFSTFVGTRLTFRILSRRWPDVFPVPASEENP